MLSFIVVQELNILGWVLEGIGALAGHSQTRQLEEKALTLGSPSLPGAWGGLGSYHPPRHAQGW